MLILFYQESCTNQYTEFCLKEKQDSSYQREALNVPTAFKVYGAAVKTLKNLNEIK